MDRALFVGTDGRDVLAFVCRPGGEFAVLRNGVPIAAWAAADLAAGLTAYDAMVGRPPPARDGPAAGA